MKSKNIIISFILSLIVIGLFFVDKLYSTNYENANTAYLVYLNGKTIGMIDNDEELYEIINNEQEEIKNKYSVDGVYPPDGFNLVEVNTYETNYTSVNEIYNKIAELDDFTIKGYTVTIKFPEEDEKEDITINVLDRTIFEEAIKKLILAFISEDELNAYLNNESTELTGIGSVINSMYFEETITIKESYISVNDEIFTDVNSLSQYLLFGADAEIDSYTVKLGDNIESISESYNLNPQEFIIANPQYRNVDTMLKVGTKVNVTLLNPVLTYIYEVYRIEESITRYESKTVVDNSKPSDYSEITTSGVTGITLNYETFQVINGEQSSELKLLHHEEVRAKVDQVTTVGRRQTTGGGYISGTFVPTEGDWQWPTNQPSVITSRYAIRWGRLHEGVDISGTGYGSPIFAVQSGVVTNASTACSSCAQWANGNYIVIRHDNGYYSAYLHLSSISVKAGDIVNKGDRIGAMGQSGYALGTHLHFALYTNGEPFAGVSTQSVDPMKVAFTAQ